MSTYHSSKLDDFVAECDRMGGLNTPETQKFLAHFEVLYDTKIDENLDPFSEEYFQQQVGLYCELSGRSLDQESGELAPLDVDTHVSSVSPYNLTDIRFLSKHTRAILTCMMMANLPPSASVLDAGCGWGLSSEAMAMCGANVTALDISPNFAELVRRRAARLGLPIEVVRCAFDTYETDKQFDLLFFYECLHHSLKPWETLMHLGQFLKNDGKIIFAGEPVNSNWWKHWGIRLDSGSIYCIRKFGWWESGWTVDFIARCFARAGFNLVVYQHVGLDNGLVGAALRSSSEARFDLSVMNPMNATTQLLLDARLEISKLREKLGMPEKSIVTRVRDFTRPARRKLAALRKGS